MEKFVMGIDNGGTNTKCVLFDLLGNEIAMVGKRSPISEPHKGWVERDLNLIWENNVSLIKKVISKAHISAEQIIGIGLTGYGNGICLVDECGDPVYPAIVSSDSRAGNVCERLLKQGVQDKIYDLTFQELWEAQTAVLMVWLKENKPEVLKRASTVLSIKDYIRMKLTGERCYELTEGTCSGLMNIHDNTFDKRIFEALGLSEFIDLMPDYTGLTDISGRITEKAAVETGLLQGTPVAGSCYDVNACALGSGILDDDTLCMIAGTWSINEVLTNKLIKGANSIARSYHPDYYIMEESSPTSASNFEWFLDNFWGKDSDLSNRESVYEECNRMVKELFPDESDVIFVPYLYASSTNPDAEGAFFNLKSMNKKEHLICAIYEGILFSAMLHIERLKNYGISFSKAKLSGGIAKSEVWSQMAADIIQMPLEVSKVSEPGALGAAMCAAIAGGVFAGIEEAVNAMVHMKKIYIPDKSKENVYRKKYKSYKKALQALNLFYSGEE